MTTDDSKIVIYDFGANNGDDLAYYLMKADLVVAVEANPKLADHIRHRYAADIASGRLKVENHVLVAGAGSDMVKFHIHRRFHVASQLSAPSSASPIAEDFAADPDQYEEIELPSIGVCELIARHGQPYYIKIDLEAYDAAILRALFAAGIKPPLISAESHGIDVFAVLVVLGGYDSFKLVEGKEVGRDFADHPVTTRNGPARFSFPFHAAGPFGDDLPGEWRDADSFTRYLALRGLGWRDIHASRIHAPVPVPTETVINYLVEARTPEHFRRAMRAGLGLARWLAALLRGRGPGWPAFDTHLAPGA